LYWSKVNCALDPAPSSTRTRLNPFFNSSCTFLGVIATRLSPGKASVGIPTVSSEYGIPDRRCHQFELFQNMMRLTWSRTCCVFRFIEHAR
jgi:hypothetical protein